MNIREKYKKETGENSTWHNKEGERFCADYVEWLELKIYKDDINKKMAICALCKDKAHIQELESKNFYCYHCVS